MERRPRGVLYDDFFIAIRHGQAYTIRALLQRGFDPNTLNPDNA